MGPYSHYVLAAKLEQVIRPENRKEYFWGAVAADIRYLANMRRNVTHLGQDRLQELMSCYAHLRSFLLGYQVHVLIDEFEQDKISQMVSSSFPLNLLKKILRKSIAPEQMIMLVEMYYLQSVTVEEALQASIMRYYLISALPQNKLVFISKLCKIIFEVGHLTRRSSRSRKLA